MARPDNSSKTELTTAAQALSPRAGRRRTLDRAAVVTAAFAIVDEDGLGALTMRRLAHELGVGLATIYGAAGGKEEILQSLVDEVLAELQWDDDSKPWDAGLVDLYCAVHEMLMAHPAIAQLAAFGPVAGLGVFELQERTLRLLRAGGLDDRTIVSAYAAVRSYVVGFTLLRSSRTGPGTDRERSREAAIAGLPVEGFPEMKRLATDLSHQLTTEHFREGLTNLLRCYASRTR